MTDQSVWEALPARVLFGRGAAHRVAAETERLGARRVLLVSGGGSSIAAVTALREALGARLAGDAGGAAQHVPDAGAHAAIARARAAAADCVVSVGGGSVTGLGKAIAMALDIPLLAVPTTYAGSEMTPVWGRTALGRKETGRDARALPRVVVYDPELCAGMPAGLAAASGMNALAHCVEALWAPGANPVTTVLAEEGVRRLAVGLPRVVADPGDLDAHAANQIGACLAGTAFAQAGGGVHHRTCHLLGGGWNLPHALTHAVLLPHATALVAPRAPQATSRVARLLAHDDAAAALDALRARLLLPGSLAEIGMPDDGVPEATRRAAEASRDDPLVPGEAAIAQMLENAHHGRPPGYVKRA